MIFSFLFQVKLITSLYYLPEGGSNFTAVLEMLVIIIYWHSKLYNQYCLEHIVLQI